MRKKFLIMLVLAAVALFIVGCQGNVAGEAVKIGGVGKQAPAGQVKAQAKVDCNTEKQQIDKLVGENEILMGELNDCKNQPSETKIKYTVEAYVTEGTKKGNFNVNGEEFSLGEGSTEILADGSTLTLLGTLWQGYAGGLKGVGFHFAGVCPTNHQVKAYVDWSKKVVSFIINEFSFALKDGETKDIPLAAGGGNITLKGLISQEYAGGVAGLAFDLYC